MVPKTIYICMEYRDTDVLNTWLRFLKISFLWLALQTIFCLESLTNCLLYLPFLFWVNVSILYLTGVCNIIHFSVWKVDLRLTRGVGEKLLLRLAAYQLELFLTASFPKRAIQFGSRIAKMEQKKEKGSQICQRLFNTCDWTLVFLFLLFLY